MSPRPLQTGAYNIVTGTVSRGSSWYENIDLRQNGAPLTGVSAFTWILTLKDQNTCSPVLTLSTDDQTLAIDEGSSGTFLQIRCASTRLSALDGDYLCDVRAIDDDTTIDGESAIYHIAHGVVTMVDEPPGNS